MKKAFLIFFLAAFVMVPLISSASGLVPCGNPGQAACTFCDFFKLFNNVINFFLIKIIPPLAALMIAIGGFIYIFSQGDPNMLDWSKRIFTSIIYGLLMIYGAFLILGVFFWFIGLNTWTTDIYHNWWQNGFFEVNCSSPPPSSP